jgi:hypothetical protein
MELLVGDEAVVQALQGDRLALAFQDARDRVRRPVDARVAEDDKRPLRQHVDQLEFRPQHGDQRGFASHEQAGHVEAVLGQQ